MSCSATDVKMYASDIKGWGFLARVRGWNSECLESMHRLAQLWGANAEADTSCRRILLCYMFRSSSAWGTCSSGQILSSSANPSALGSRSFPSLLLLNLLATIANLIVADTIFSVGFQLCSNPSFLTFDQTPSAKDKLPHLLAFLARLKRVWRCSCHCGHLNKKFSTDSNSRPYSHIFVSTAPIFAK